MGQRKAFYRHIIPESSCAGKGTVGIDIHVTSRKGDRKIMKPIRITSRPLLRIWKWNQLSQFRWHLPNTYRKDLSWLHFDNEPRVWQSLQVKDQQSHIFIFIAYLTIPSSNYEYQPKDDNSIPCMAVWWI